MSPLTQESGGTNEERIAEKDKIVDMIDRQVDWESMTDNEQRFIEKITDAQYVSPKQLFWLRDIKDKYL
jgi:hypothetical protein